MRYSCFDDASGVYRVFEDGHRVAVNGDLPIPRAGKEAGRVGIPAIEAGRDLPPQARYVGNSWLASGLVVRCGPQPLGAVDWPGAYRKYGPPVAIVGGLIFMFWLWRKTR